MQKWGNQKCNAYWEAKMPANFPRPDEHSSMAELEKFIRAKYEQKRWAGALPVAPAEEEKPRVSVTPREEDDMFSMSPTPVATSPTPAAAPDTDFFSDMSFSATPISPAPAAAPAPAPAAAPAAAPAKPVTDMDAIMSLYNKPAQPAQPQYGMQQGYGMQQQQQQQQQYGMNQQQMAYMQQQQMAYMQQQQMAYSPQAQMGYSPQPQMGYSPQPQMGYNQYGYGMQQQPQQQQQNPATMNFNIGW